MMGDWSTEVRREYFGLDVRFDLPVRPLGAARAIGALLAVFGLFFLWSPAYDLGRLAIRLARQGPDGVDVLAALPQIPVALLGCAPLFLGLLILLGRCRVEWKDGRLRSMEILGPLRWTRRLPRQAVRRLGLLGAPSGEASVPGRLDALAVLFAELESGQRRIVAIGYPRVWLLPLAQELAGILGGVEVDSTPLAAQPLASPAPRQHTGLVAQPAKSQVQIDEWTSGARLAVPAAGLWRGSSGLFFFSLIWCGFIAVFTAVLVPVGLKGGDLGWVPVLILGAFWVVGLILLSAAINMGRRTAVILAEGGRLQIDTRGLFGARQWVWSPGEVADVRTGGSGMTVNNRPVLELQIHSVAGAKVGILAGRDEGELRWMAGRLRQALNVPAPGTEGSSAD